MKRLFVVGSLSLIMALSLLAGCSAITGDGESSKSLTDTPTTQKASPNDGNDGNDACREIAEKFALARYTNQKLVNGEYEHDASFDSVCDEYVAADSELKEWSADSDLEFDNSILLRGGSPVIAQSSEVTDVQGSAYYVTVKYNIVAGAGQSEASTQKAELVVIFNESNLIEHAWPSAYYDSQLHGSRDAYAAYGVKVRELVDRYGKPRIASAANEANTTYASGLAYAGLIDFGDGDPRLVTCYLDTGNCKDPSQPGAYPEDYRVEAWQYSSQGLEPIYSDTAQLDGQNTYCGAIFYCEHGGKTYLSTRGGNYGGPQGSITYCAYGINDDGNFGLVTELTNTYSYQDKEYTLNGRSVSDEEGQAISSEWFDYENLNSIGLSPMKHNNFAPYDLIRKTNTVIAVLEACAASA